MICKKCGKEVDRNHYSGLVESHINFYKMNRKEIPTLLLNEYKNHHRFFGCKNCNQPIDYKDMPMEMFFRWLKASSDDGDSRETSSKALIRYFELDKLLELKKGAGDFISEK